MAALNVSEYWKKVKQTPSVVFHRNRHQEKNECKWFIVKHMQGSLVGEWAAAREQEEAVDSCCVISGEVPIAWGSFATLQGVFLKPVSNGTEPFMFWHPSVLCQELPQKEGNQSLTLSIFWQGGILWRRVTSAQC